ncbi:hypothetical protein ELI41_29665 (plasmid) [Rhizobium leguminosarum]|uniref:hypothetical protein n=1 Tax=Rhizobium leguminosarum TaxID=384 RepID=UPI00102F765A|nr:hypothetical protein [Rhizobium leguminosarum]TAU80476.1 hypothetical protein ELI41_29665 [Rhizobium leguminosarum]
MTAEICMMNRLAVVLAADSATTVSRWVDGKREERYFKGANKIFQLSDHHPVGLMIFDSASILNVPWEVVIKTFRSQLSKKSFNTVEEYARELFDFLNDNPGFFPEEVQRDEVSRAARGVFFSWAAEALEGVAEEDTSAAIVAYFQAKQNELDGINVSDCLGAEHFQKTSDDLKDTVRETIETVLPRLVTDGVDIGAIATASLHEVMKRPASYLSTTGLIFAGFGDHQIFPAVVEYQSCGVVGGKHIYSTIGAMALDHSQSAWLGAFAQTSMIDTFSGGVSLDVYRLLMLAIEENLKGFATEVVAKSEGDFSKIDDLEGLVQAWRRKIGEMVLEKARKEHSLPLRSVLGSLPVNEMADLAETLITLQSLKEKVTKPSETVGGPVDVAIITKHEGLVWVKRKHFFDADLNSRFKLRQAAQHDL